MLKIGFDVSQAAHSGGVGIYTKNLALELQNIADLEMVYFFSSLRQKPPIGLKNLKKYKLPPTLFEMLFNKWRNVPIEKFIGPVDVFHSSDWTQPPSKAKKVTTIHDIVPLKYPEWSHPKIVAVHKRRLRLVEKEIDMVICVSRATQKDLLEISNLPKEKTVVIYEGVSENFKPQNPEAIKDFKQKYHLPEEFVLSIGGVGERRNLKRVKEAAKKYDLVVTGETIPWLSVEEMPLLYASAKVLLYPSFYEGFGLPIIEAMACGTPVITSNVSSMPEAGGEAAEYVNPESVIDIENKLKFVWNDKKKRETMIKKGFIQAKKFSWQKSAEETAEVYRKLVSDSQ
jgi:glycosyltransferase involved in cell wall biosynthesis